MPKTKWDGEDPKINDFFKIESRTLYDTRLVRIHISRVSVLCWVWHLYPRFCYYIDFRLSKYRLSFRYSLYRKQNFFHLKLRFFPFNSYHNLLKMYHFGNIFNGFDYRYPLFLRSIIKSIEGTWYYTCNNIKLATINAVN